ncbi:MAG: 1-carboxybiuret hydrolase subunit AtzG-like [Acidimicrobiaceae bacterium]|nr:1-carboxybiuret hydrolase subunit AtzG-like [Acidimicrobiaceae bacterium]
MRSTNAEAPDLDGYARAAALAAGLTIDGAWWPGVVRHLGVLLERAASLECNDDDDDNDNVSLPDDPAPVFTP